MVIPEELLKYSEKELDEILTTNPLKAKYIFVNKNIYRKEGRMLNKIFFKNPNNKYNLELRYENLKNETALDKSLLDSLKKEIKKEQFDNFSDKKIAEVYYNKIKSVFGEEYTDLQFIGEDYYRGYDIVVWIPSITISNSFEQELEMKDLYVKFYFYEKRLQKISLARTTATEKELRNNYIFSHLNNESLGHYGSSLCMGNTPISRIHRLMLNGNPYDTFANIELFSHMFKEYLSWESLEGVPYVKIDYVINDTNRFVSAYCPDYYLNEIWPKLYERLNDFEFEYQLVNNKYTINLTNESKNKIKLILNETVDKRYIFYSNNGNSVELRDDTNEFYDNLNNKDSEVKFKGEIVKMKVIQDGDFDSTELPMEVHSELLNNVVRRIERDFVNYIYNKKLKERE